MICPDTADDWEFTKSRPSGAWSSLGLKGESHEIDEEAQGRPVSPTKGEGK
jgi:hypothetical protein